MLLITVILGGVSLESVSLLMPLIVVEILGLFCPDVHYCLSLKILVRLVPIFIDVFGCC